MNNKVYILVGVPGSGKTTWAKKHLLKNSNCIRVTRDDFRLMLRNQYVCEPKIETLVNKLEDETILNALAMHLDVVIDNTNLKSKKLNHYKDLVKYSADVEFILFDISLKKALEQNQLRDAKVEENYLKKKYEEWEILRDSYVFQNVKKTNELKYILPDKTSDLPEAVIFDVDGTLALLKNRGPFDYEKVYLDEVNIIVKEQIDYNKSLGRKIIIVSGRPEDCRKMTEDWFDLYDIKFDAFFMRPKDDYRKDTVIKREIYESEIKDKYNVVCVFDDRKSVVKEWREMGLFVFDVNQFIHIF